MQLKHWLTDMTFLGRRTTTRLRRHQRSRSSLPAEIELLEERTLLTVFTVTTLVDEDGGALDADSAGSDGAGLSLREAIRIANENGGGSSQGQIDGDQIVFDSLIAGGIITLNVMLGQLEIRDDLLIDGQDQNLGDGDQGDIEVNGNSGVRVFLVDTATAPGSSIIAAFTNLLITDGLATDGAGIFETLGSIMTLDNVLVLNHEATESGAGLVIEGTAAISFSLIRDNRANATGGVGGGGGIYLTGSTSSLTLDHTEISQNTAQRDGGGIFLQNGSINSLGFNIISDNVTSVLGGGIVNEGGTITLSSDTIAQNISGTAGGGIHNTSNGIINSLGFNTISNNVAQGNDGGGIFNNGGTITLSSDTITQNTARRNGGGIFNSGGTITSLGLNTISNNVAQLDDGGGIASFGGTITLSSDTIVQNTAQLDGGGISNTSGTLTATGALVIDSNQASRGGGIFSDTSFQGTLNLDGTSILSNTALVDGGGLFLDGTGNAILTNGSVSSNFATGAGGGILNGIGTLTLSSETITQNTAQTIGGGIFNVGGTLNSLGLNTISNNVAQSGGGGIFNSSGSVTLGSDTITQNTVQAGGGGGLFNTNNGTITSLGLNVISSNVAQFGGGISNIVGTLALSSDTITQNTAQAEGGGIFNGEEGIITSLGSNTISNNVAQSNGGGISNQGLLTLGSTTFNQNSTGISGGGLVNFGTGTANVSSSTFSGNSAAVSGGAVLNFGTLNLSLTTFNQNFAADDGGGLLNFGTANVSSSTFSGNSASDDGGAIANVGLLDLSSTTLDQNSAGSAGGGLINFTNATVEISSSTISGNSAAETGGGLRNDASATATVSISTFSGNLTDSGGAIINFGTLDLLDSSIISNTASGSGGGIFDVGDGSVTLTNVNVDFNRAGSGVTGDGGGLFVDGNSIVTIVDGSVNLNFAANDGGGIWNSSSAFNISSVVGASLLSNTAGNGDGGAIYNAGGTLTIADGVTVGGNVAIGSGGAILNDDDGTVNVIGSFLLFNSAISGPTADIGGGGIRNRAGTVMIADSFLTGNSARNNPALGLAHGGGIWNDEAGTLNVLNTNFFQNEATNDGGAIYNQGLVVIDGSQFGTLQLGTDYWELENQNAGELVFAYVDTQASLLSGQGANATLNVRADDETAFEFDDDDGPSFRSPLIAGAELLQTGSVFFQVDGLDADAIDPYQLYTAVVDLTVMTFESGSNNNAQSADLIVENQLVTGDVLPNDVDFFSFTANVGDTIVVMLDDNPDNNGLFTNTDLALLDANENVIGLGNNLSFADANGVGAVTALSTGTFYVRVQSGSASADTGYRFVVRVYPAGSTVFEDEEPNDVPAEAIRLTETRFGQGVLRPLVQNTAERGGAIFNAFDGLGSLPSVTVSNSSFQHNVATSEVGGEGGGAIYNAGEFTLDQSTLSQNTALADGGGVFNAGTGTITFIQTTLISNVAERDGGGLANAGEANLVVSSITDRLLMDDPQDTWETQGVNTGNLVFAFVDTQGSLNNTDSTLSVRANDGLEIEFDDDDGPSFLSSVVAGALVPQTGSVFYEITDKSNFDPLEQYELYAAVVNPSLAQAEVEGNNTSGMANAIFENVLITGSVAGVDEDWFSISANAGDTLLVIMDDDPERDGLLTDTDLILFGSDGATFFTFGNNSSLADGNAVIQVSLPDTGTYFIRVGNGQFGQANSYRFVAQVISPADVLNEVEPNDDRASATGIDAGRFGRGSFNDLLLNSGLPNVAVRGGGVYNTGTLNTALATIEGNAATQDGGGIYNDGGTVTIEADTSILGNQAINGGGVFSQNGVLEIFESSIADNTAVGNGGGLHVAGLANVIISGGTINGNVAAGGGGGIYNTGGTLFIQEAADVSSNRATGLNSRGGGLLNVGGLVTTQDSTFAMNTADFGGGLASEGPGAVLTLGAQAGQLGTTVFANVANRDGGGIFNDLASTLVVDFATVTGNRADNGSGGGVHNLGNAAITNSSIGNEADSVEISDTWTVAGANAGDLIFAHVDTQRSLASLRDPDSTLTILAQDGATLLAFDDDSGFGLGSAVAGVSVPGGQDGHVFFDVRNFGTPDAMDYDLYTAVVDPASAIVETEGNNDTTSADPILTNRLVTGTLADLNDVDTFSFAVPAVGSRIVVLFDPMQTSGLLVEILDPLGNVVVTGSGSDRAVGAVMALSEGTHFVRVRNAVGDYRFVTQVFNPVGAVQEIEPNDNPATATLLTNVQFGQGALDPTPSNRANRGGGIFNAGTLGIGASLVQNNEATGTNPLTDGGGGIYNQGALVLVDGTSVESNLALGSSGGGLVNTGLLAMTDSKVFGNSTSGSGGGLANLAGATASLLRSTIGGVADSNDLWVSRGVNNGDLVFAYLDTLNNFNASTTLTTFLDEGSRLLEADSGDGPAQGSVVAGAIASGLQPTPAGKTNDVFFDVRSADPDLPLPDYNLYTAIVNPASATIDNDNNNSTDAAQLIPTSATGSLVVGNVPGGDVDVFRLDNVPNASRIVVIGDGDLDNDGDVTSARFELFDRIADPLDPLNTLRDRILAEESGASLADASAAAITVGGSSGSYFIRITNGNAGSAASYRFVVLVLPLQNEVLETEPNNQPQTAEELSPGQFGRGGLLVVNGNQAAEGGGLYNLGVLTVDDSTIGRNTANLDGGGLANDGTAYVRRSTFENNQAFANGGGISNRSALELRNATLSGNNALGNGGGLDLVSPLSSVGILHSTITNNVATFGEGGGVFRLFFEENVGQLILYSSIVSGNFHEAGGSRFSDLFGTVSKDSSFNFIGVGDTQIGLANNVNFNVVGSFALPFDPVMGPLDDNGGPTRTHALQVNSPALLSGPPVDVFNVLTDQRGSGFQRLFGPRIDVGAFELQSPTGGQLDIFVSAAVGFDVPPPPGGPAALISDVVNVSTVTIRDPITNQVTAVITPYPGFQGEIRVASADVSGDGFPDVITVPGPGALAFIRAFSGRTQFFPGTTTVLYNIGDPIAFTPFGVGFAAFGPFAGGAFIAAADMFISPQLAGGQVLPGQDGVAEIVVSADFGGGPHVRVFDGLSGAIVRDFFAYEVSLLSGARVAVGDLSGDGIPDIITATGPGVPSHVRVFNAVDFAFSSQAPGQLGVAISGLAGIPARLANFFPFELSFIGGTFIAAGRIDEDGVIDIVSSRGAGFAEIRINSGLSGEFIGSTFAFPFAFLGGARVALNDVNGDGLADLFVTPAILGTSNQVRVFIGLDFVLHVRSGLNPALTPQPLPGFEILSPRNSSIAASNRAAGVSGGRSNFLLVEAGFIPASEVQAPQLAPQQLELIVEAAKVRLIGAGVPAETVALIDQVEFQIVDLPDQTIALTVGATILIDQNAAGFGWLIDPTPLTDEEFTPEGFFIASESERERLDLLTVVLHELAHVFGAGHVDEAEHPDHLLLDRLPPGRRRVSDSHDLEAFFSSQHLEALLAEIE